MITSKGCKGILRIKLRIALTVSAFLSALFSNAASVGDTNSVILAPAPIYIDQVEGLVPDQNEIRAGLLYDISRNTIVWEKDMNYAYPIASLTKMMVGLLAFEDIEAGKINLADRVEVKRQYKEKISRRRFKTWSTTENYSLEDLLKMAMVASHNESTVWIAQHCSPTLDDFIERMNQRAAELGMTKTFFSNTSGLPAIERVLDNSSSAHDMLLLGLEVLKHPGLMQITAMPEINIYNGNGTLAYHNHNGLVINYNKEVDGIKTGYTKAAGFCLVSTASRGGHRLMGVVFGVRSPWIRNGLVASMMNSYYEAMKLGRLGDTEVDMNQACAFLDSVNGGFVCVRPSFIQKKNNSDDAYAYTYKTSYEKVRKTITVRAGDNLGKVAMRYDVAVADLKRWNKLKGNSIRKGQTLALYKNIKKVIPVKLVVDPDETYADNQPQDNAPVDINAEGDTFPALADADCETQDTGSNATEQKNENKQLIQAKHIQKQTASENKSAKKDQPYIYHTVQPGDTLWHIAQVYQANIDLIKKVNRITNSKSLKSGTRIKIPVVKG